MRYDHHHHHHHRMYHETQISFCIRRSVCTDCSDRSHPSHIGFVAGNRIHVHLCCYYRAIGVFVYWLTKSTDIESDNRHYFCPAPDPFSNPTAPPSPLPLVAPSLCPAPAHVTPPTEPTDPPNIAAGRVKRVRERNHRCVCTFGTQPNPELRFDTCVGEEGGGACTTPKTSVHSDRVSVHRRGTLGAGCCRRFAPVQTVKMPVHTCMCMCMCIYVGVGTRCLIIVEIVHRADFPT